MIYLLDRNNKCGAAGEGEKKVVRFNCYYHQHSDKNVQEFENVRLCLCLAHVCVFECVCLYLPSPLAKTIYETTLFNRL